MKRSKKAKVRPKSSKKAPKKKTPKKSFFRRIKNMLPKKRTSSLKKPTTSRKMSRKPAQKTNLHKMLTAEGWKRLMMAKSGSR